MRPRTRPPWLLASPDGVWLSVCLPICPPSQGHLSIHSCSHLTRVWLCRSHTAMLPSLQQEKQTLASGLMAKA